MSTTVQERLTVDVYGLVRKRWIVKTGDEPAMEQGYFDTIEEAIEYGERLLAAGVVPHQCQRRAEWQIWDALESPDGNTLACSEHVGHLLTTDGGSVVPAEGAHLCCYIVPGVEKEVIG